MSVKELADTPLNAALRSFSRLRARSGSGLVLPTLPSLLLEWWVYTDLMFRRFIQSLRVLAGMLCFMLDLLMDWPSIMSLRAAWRLSSVYCLYLRTGAEFNKIPDFRFEGGELLAANEVNEPVNMGLFCEQFCSAAS